MTRKEASRKAAKNAAFVTNWIKAYRKMGVHLDGARALAHVNLKEKKMREAAGIMESPTKPMKGGL